jgi:hypothetical protein
MTVTVAGTPAPVARAVGAGLRNRLSLETAADTLAWDRTRDWSAPMGVGTRTAVHGGMPTPEREREVLDTWRARLNYDEPRLS